jgi:hypothetical protein
MEQWQYEVTAGGRLLYGVDDERTIVWLMDAMVDHPKPENNDPLRQPKSSCVAN